VYDDDDSGCSLSEHEVSSAGDCNLALKHAQASIRFCGLSYLSRLVMTNFSNGILAGGKAFLHTWIGVVCVLVMIFAKNG
jgi:hypothetical protein